MGPAAFLAKVERTINKYEKLHPNKINPICCLWGWDDCCISQAVLKTNSMLRQVYNKDQAFSNCHLLMFLLLMKIRRIRGVKNLHIYFHRMLSHLFTGLVYRYLILIIRFTTDLEKSKKKN